MIKKPILPLALLMSIYTLAYSKSAKAEHYNDIKQHVEMSPSELQKKTVRTVHLDVENGGKYYLSLWLLGSKTMDGTFKHFPVKVNGIVVDTITTSSANWQEVKSSRPYQFRKGKNVIEFIDSAPHIANVSELILSQDCVTDTNVSNVYNEYITTLKRRKSIQTYSYIPTFSRSFNFQKGDETIFPFDASCIVGFRAKYTFSKMLECKAGDILEISTNPTTGGPYVIDVYNLYEPSSLSLCLEYNGLLGHKITIPKTGRYIVRLRGNSEELDYDGVCDLRINGDFYEDVPYSNNDIPISHTDLGRNLMFACNNIDIVPSLSIQGTDNKVLETGYYQPSGIMYLDMENFKSVGSVYIYSDSPTRPYYPVDIYFNTKRLDNDFIFKVFPNLKNTFVPVVSSKDDSYNCFAWSVGIWDHWEDPTFDFLVDIDSLGGDKVYPEELYYDDFYYSNGYIRCENYDDAAIAVWGDEASSSFVHASVRKHSNSDSIPHGYYWESKMGCNERIFHYDDQFKNGAYGKPFAYYKPNARNLTKSLYEKVADNEVVLLTSNINDINIDIINKEIQSIDKNTKDEFLTLYNKWRADVKKSIYSTFNQLKALDSYQQVRMCVAKDSTLHYMLMGMLAEDDQFVLPLLYDEVCPKYKKLCKELVDKIDNIQAQSIYKKVYCNNIDKAKMLVNALLERKSINIQNDQNEEGNITLSNQSKMFVNCQGNVCKINMEIASEAPTICKIFTVQGQLIATLINNEQLETSYHNLEYSLPKSGTYIIYLKNGNNINIKKVVAL